MAVKTTNHKRKRYDDAFKREAVRRVRIENQTPERVATEMGFSSSGYKKWAQKFGHEFAVDAPAPTNGKMTEVTVTFTVQDPKQVDTFIRQMLDLGLEIRMKQTKL